MEDLYFMMGVFNNKFAQEYTIYLFMIQNISIIYLKV